MHAEVIIKQKRKSTKIKEEIKVSVFRFPKNPVERERWKKTVPIAVGENTAEVRKDKLLR